jgi:hypothetical protein
LLLAAEAVLVVLVVMQVLAAVAVALFHMEHLP